MSAIYAKSTRDLPLDHYVQEIITVAPINQDEVIGFDSDPFITVTSIFSTREEVLAPGTGTLHFRDGHSESVSTELLPLALNGGGQFLVAYQNPIHDQPYTREKAEEIEREDAEADFMFEYGD
jgi:hypothetical protein